MELKGRISVGDLMAAQWVHLRPRRSLAVFGILLLGLVGFIMTDSFVGRRQSLTDPMIWILPGILAYVAFIAFVRVPRYVRRSSDYLKWKEGKSVFLLYLSDHLFQIVPKGFFATHEDIDAFRNIVRQSIDGQS